ncbi:MAG: DEAD/DEAH box helicase [Desulfobulbaceae bacterium DB1]|nr:MAG: DEAD/DEAH box helicase [Desulfobulbaceae bacterium DB1]
MTAFKEIGVSEGILKALQALGFEQPTPVQEKIIPLMLEQRRDLVGLAQTGTGKTAAFGIPLVQLIDTRLGETQGLVLCPTRELCVQVARDIAALGQFLPQLRVSAVYGGANIEQQIRDLRRGAQLIIATPGRLHDLLRRGVADLSHITTVVLDEADEMLQMGFQDELNAILAHTPQSKNTLLFSATMSKEVATIAAKYMNKPLEITIGQRNVGTENVRHLYYMIHARDRFLALKRIVDGNPGLYSIIFCRTREETKDVADKLMQEGYSVDALHGDLSQGQRDLVMGRFRSRNLQMLVATDVAARGLDVNDLTHVINYNLPDDIASYTHRSGRTGRAGKTGTSIAIIHLREKHKIKEIEQRLGRKFELSRIPTGHEICQKQLLSLVDTLQNRDVDHAQIEPFFAQVAEKLASFDREELIKRFLSIEFNRFLDYYRNVPDLNQPEEKRQSGRQSDRQSDRQTERRPLSGKSSPRQFQGEQFARFYLNVGKKDGLLPQRIIGEINEMNGGSRIKIGKIEIMKHSSLVEADNRFISEVLGAFRHLVINGKPVAVEVVEEKNGGAKSAAGSRPARAVKGSSAPKYPKSGSRRAQR